MTNDLTTLSGALVEAKDQLISELANKGVTATYDPTTGLLGLIAHIADIQGGEAIYLTTDKNILSYADSETATLTAVHSEGSGKSLAVYNAVSGSKIGDMTDNQDGTYSYTYSSTGVGDISMTCATTSGESNSISIEDCYYYDTTEYTSGTTLNLNLPNNPFICTFDMNKVNNGYPSLNFGEDTSNYLVVGVGFGDGRCAFQYFVNGSRTELLSTSNSVSTNTYYSMSYSYNNGTHTYNAVNNTLTSTKTGVTMNKLIGVDCFNGKVKNIKIKPLTTQ